MSPFGYEVLFAPSPPGEVGGGGILGFLPVGQRTRRRAVEPYRGQDKAKRARNKARRQAIKKARKSKG